MVTETYRHFKYEIALGAEIPMPKPPIDYYEKEQFSVQQYLHTLCKVHVGSLGKIEGKWAFGPDAPKSAKLGSRPDITQIFDYAEKMGIIEAAPGENLPPAEGEEAPSEGAGPFTPYKLSQGYWTAFDRFAQ